MKTIKLLPIITLLSLSACNEKVLISPYDYGIQLILQEQQNNFAIKFNVNEIEIKMYNDSIRYEYIFECEEDYDYSTYTTLYTKYLFQCYVDSKKIEYEYDYDLYYNIRLDWLEQKAY